MQLSLSTYHYRQIFWSFGVEGVQHTHLRVVAFKAIGSTMTNITMIDSSFGSATAVVAATAECLGRG